MNCMTLPCRCAGRGGAPHESFHWRHTRATRCALHGRRLVVLAAVVRGFGGLALPPCTRLLHRSLGGLSPGELDALHLLLAGWRRRRTTTTIAARHASRRRCLPVQARRVERGGGASVMNDARRRTWSRAGWRTAAAVEGEGIGGIAEEAGRKSMRGRGGERCDAMGGGGGWG